MTGDEQGSPDAHRLDGARIPAPSRRPRHCTRAPPVQFGSSQEAPGKQRLNGFMFTKENVS
jgi:hypothetical protein